MTNKSAFIVTGVLGLSMLSLAPSALAMPTTNESASIVVNHKVVVTGEILTYGESKFIPVTMVCAALRSVRGSTIPDAPTNEFTVSAIWYKAENTLSIVTPRYAVPMALKASSHSNVTLELDGQKFPHSIPEVTRTVKGIENTYVPMSYMSRILAHLNIQSSFDPRGQWNWIANPVTPADSWVEETPPFNGDHVTWGRSDMTQGALPDSTLIRGYMWPPRTRFQSAEFRKMQSFQGRLAGKTFAVTIYMKKTSREMLSLLGIRYGDKVTTAFSPGYGALYPVNFTGDHLVLRLLSNYNHWLALNIKTGELTTGNSVMNLSGYYHAIPRDVGFAIGPTYVLGLPQKYPSIK